MQQSESKFCILLMPTVTGMHRKERVAEVLREEIAQIVGYELEDPRLMMVTVTEVRLADNQREEHRLAFAALRRAAPYVRKQLGLALNLPRTPELHFVRDKVEEDGERVDQLLEQIENEWKSKERVKDDN